MVVSAPVLLTFTAATFGMSALLVSRLRDVSTISVPAERLTRSMLVGVRYLLTNRVAGVSTAVSACVTAAGGALLALLVVWMNEQFAVREGDARLGFFFAAFALADVVGGFGAYHFGRRFGEVRAIRLAVPLACVSAYAMLAAQHWALAVAMLFITSGFSSIAIICLVTLRQRSTPDHLMSRVNTAGRSIAYGAGFALGALTSGSLAESRGAVVGLGVAFSTLLLGGAAAWSLLPSQDATAL
jgi:hypothetical protein